MTFCSTSGIVNSMLAWKFDLDTEVWTPIADAPINAVRKKFCAIIWDITVTNVTHMMFFRERLCIPG